MPRIVDCIKSESETPANVIRLVKVSGGFLRAYNRSAWKFHTFINDYKVKRMFVKSANEEVVSLGFPETSLHTLTDGRQMTTTDLGFDLMLKPEETLRADDYEAWVAAIPVTNNSRSDYEAFPPREAPPAAAGEEDDRRGKGDPAHAVRHAPDSARSVLAAVHAGGVDLKAVHGMGQQPVRQARHIGRRRGGQVTEDLPAAGNRNGTSLNNAGSNGNYWSSSPNPNNSDNAYNMNFNSGNYDWNNNNRYNGFTVRPVPE